LSEGASMTAAASREFAGGLLTTKAYSPATTRRPTRPAKCHQHRDDIPKTVLNLKGLQSSNAKTEGFLTNRTADRGGNHPDHRSYRNS
jgi:hypothetical protein